MQTLIPLAVILIAQAAVCVESYSFNDQDYSCYHANAWKNNVDKASNSLFSAYVDIVKSTYVAPATATRRLQGSGPSAPRHTGEEHGDASTSSLASGWKVSFHNIPRYTRTLTASDINALNDRPRAASDFSAGETSAKVGDKVVFGGDLGYASTNCSLGYWPPGVICPSGSTQVDMTFTLTPAEEIGDGCYTGTKTGYFVNGVDLHSWSNGRAYNDGNLWHEIALEWDALDLDLCAGNTDASSHEYRHFGYSSCLGTQLNEVGTAHSTVYGFAKDGFPIFGPYQAANTLAASCWQLRDYSNAATTGCVDGARSCVLHNPLDYTEGTATTTTTGPSFTASLLSSTGNSITAENGVFFEDYFFNATCAAQAGRFLDEHNGHSHDGIGYHYHLTVDAQLAPTFPYAVGPQYFGCLPSGAGYLCGSSYEYSAGDNTATASVSTCGAAQGLPLNSQECLSKSFDIYTSSTSSKKSGRLLKPAARLGVFIAIVVFLIGVAGVAMYFCCGKTDEYGMNKTVPVQDDWHQHGHNDMEMYPYGEDDPYAK